MHLSALDFARDIPDTVECAALCDQVGLRRYWIAEHQPQAHPAVTLVLLGDATDHIRLGTAAILLPLHSPLAAAMDFRLLASLFPGRIDAGVCRGLAGGTATKFFPPPAEDFAERVEAFCGLTRGDPQILGDFHSFVPPAPIPDLWIHGAGPGSVTLAARHGMKLGMSLFNNFSKDDPSQFDRYRQDFRGTSPECVVAIAGICAETEGEAQRLREKFENPSVVPTVVGGQRQCVDKIREIAHRFAVDEVVFLDVSPTIEARKQTYCLLADGLGLTPRPISA